MIANSCFHCWRHSQGLMNPAEIVVHVMERHRVLQILKLFAECISESGKSAYRHSHRQILALNVASRNVIVIGSAADNRLASAHAHSGAVSCSWSILRRPVNLLQRRKIDVFSKCIPDRFRVRAMAIRRELHAIGQSFSCFVRQYALPVGLDRVWLNA